MASNSIDIHLRLMVYESKNQVLMAAINSMMDLLRIVDTFVRWGFYAHWGSVGTFFTMGEHTHVQFRAPSSRFRVPKQYSSPLSENLFGLYSINDYSFIKLLEVRPRCAGDKDGCWMAKIG